MTTETPADDSATKLVDPFNGPVEIGLRALTILCQAYPAAYSLQRLVVSDYLLVHSDDLPDGPSGLHPKTPHRSGELLIRRNVIEAGLLLYHSRGLIERKFTDKGVFFAATERSAAFLNALSAEYSIALQDRAAWLNDNYRQLTDGVLEQIVREHLGDWGAEFVMESVLWDDSL